LLSAGCSDDDPNPPAEPTFEASGNAVLTDDARVLDAAGTKALTQVAVGGDDEALELTFSRSSAVLDQLEPGHTASPSVSSSA
jgi:hypothetical protein